MDVNEFLDTVMPSLGEVTHFADWAWTARTLCGQNWEGIILTADKATCPTCIEAHRSEGWTFPLPAVVV